MSTNQQFQIQIVEGQEGQERGRKRGETGRKERRQEDETRETRKDRSEEKKNAEREGGRRENDEKVRRDEIGRELEGRRKEGRDSQNQRPPPPPSPRTAHLDVGADSQVQIGVSSVTRTAVPPPSIMNGKISFKNNVSGRTSPFRPRPQGRRNVSPLPKQTQQTT